MTRLLAVLRWAAAAFLALCALVYFAAVSSVLPAWALLPAVALYAWLLLRLLGRRRGWSSSLGGQTRTSSVEAL